MFFQNIHIFFLIFTFETTPLTLYDPPPIFCSHAFNIGAALLCVGDVPKK